MKNSVSLADNESGRIGSCKLLFGTVKAISENGDLRTLYTDSPVFMYDHIMTGLDGLVSIRLNDAAATRIDLGRVAEIVLDETAVDLENMQESEALEEAVGQLQLSLLVTDIDPTVELDPAAAGSGEQGLFNAGGGTAAVRFELTGQEQIPELTGLETHGDLFEFSHLEPVVSGALSTEPMQNSLAVFPAFGGPLMVEIVSVGADPGEERVPTQDMILVDEAGNCAIASLGLSSGNEMLSSLQLSPLDENGLPVESGNQVMENGEPLVINGAPAYWFAGDDGSWSVVVMRPVTAEPDSNESDDHEENKPTEMDLPVAIDSQEYFIHVCGFDEVDGAQGGGWLHANGQGLGVGNPFINMDAGGSEMISFDFSALTDVMPLYRIELGIDHLSGEQGNKPAEEAVWQTFNSSGESIDSGVLVGTGQGSGGADQVLDILFGEGSEVVMLAMSYADPSGEEGAVEVCGQGYRISSLTGYDSEGNELFASVLKKSESESSHEDQEGDSAGEQGQETSTEYMAEVLFTIYPEMDNTGTMYTGMYVVNQNASFHDNTFSFVLSGGEEGKLEEKILHDGEMTLVITASDPDAKGTAVVKGNGQGLGVGNPFIDMDGEGSECLHFNFLDADGAHLNMVEVTLGVDHLSGATGGHAAEFAQWEAYVMSDGQEQLVGSGLLEGQGQGSGWQSDQELTIHLTADDGTPVYFNSLSLSVASEDTLPQEKLSDSGVESGHDHSADEQNGAEGGGEEVCGQSFRVSAIDGVYDPGDHVFAFIATGENGLGGEVSAVFDLTFDGDGYVQGGNEDEVISGSSGDDFLRGGGGDDILLGGSGNDILLGGDGNDVLLGGDDTDILIGQRGEDIIFGDDPYAPDDAVDQFDETEVKGNEVLDYDMQEDLVSSGDALEHLIPFDVDELAS